MRHVTVGPVTIGNDLSLVFLSGPCQIESRAHALEVASALKEMAQAAGTTLDAFLDAFPTVSARVTLIERDARAEPRVAAVMHPAMTTRTRSPG